MVGLHDVGFSDRPAQPHRFASPLVGVHQSSDPCALLLHLDQRHRDNVHRSLVLQQHFLKKLSYLTHSKHGQ